MIFVILSLSYPTWTKTRQGGVQGGMCPYDDFIENIPFYTRISPCACPLGQFELMLDH